MTRADKVNELYLRFNDRLTGNVYNCLWQLIVNEAQPNAAFELLPSDNSLILALPKGGYIETGVTPAAENDQTICADLNQAIYGLSEQESTKIGLHSMRQVQYGFPYCLSS